MYGKHLNHSEETKIKISRKMKGRVSPTKGMKFSNETRLKMRLSRIKQIQEDKFNGNQMFPSYNKNACKIIEKYGKENGYNFQHVMNGGEFYIKN